MIDFLFDMDVLSSCQKVISQSRSVFFHPERIAPAISAWGELLGFKSSWDHPCHFFNDGAETVRWIFTLDVLNHCFWPDPGEQVWTVHYGGSPWSGYWGLAASLKRAIEMELPITAPHFMSRISESELAFVFSGDGRIPMFEQRLCNLREAGAVILSKLGGDVVSLFGEAAGSAVRLVHRIVSLFPSFRDTAQYHGLEIAFLKRAQIFAYDVFTAFDGRGLGDFHDVEELTAFADYKLPQVLRELGIISYGPSLAAGIDALENLDPGSEEEVEIRAMTIRSVEEIRKALQREGREVTNPRIDSWLWQLGQQESFRKRPYHRCRTIFY
ncbi:MAG: queuosine salvage family protein [Syntrophobacteraceae bacterium]